MRNPCTTTSLLAPIQRPWPAAETVVALADAVDEATGAGAFLLGMGKGVVGERMDVSAFENKEANVPFYLRSTLGSKRLVREFQAFVRGAFCHKKPDQEVGVQVGNIVDRLLHGSTFIIVQDSWLLTTSTTTCRITVFRGNTAPGYLLIHECSFGNLVGIPRQRPVWTPFREWRRCIGANPGQQSTFLFFPIGCTIR